MNKYEVLGVVGEGAYGIVLKCRNKSTGNIVAIKKFKESEEDESVRKTIVREVKLLRMLKHENVVHLNEAFRRKGKLYLVFEYVDKNLLEVLEEQPKGVDPWLIQKYIYQMCKALEFCHQNDVIHRDIKPENLLVSLDHKVMLCDFGFARTVTNNVGPITDYVATRWYRPPELLLGTGIYDNKVDIYAVGCIMAELVDGQPLIPGDSDVDQLSKTVKLLGQLTDEQTGNLQQNMRFKGVRINEVGNSGNIDRRYLGKLPRIALQFMKACLKMDPAERLSAIEALRHPYFDSIRERCYEEQDEYPNVAQQQVTPVDITREISKPHSRGKSIYSSSPTIKVQCKANKPRSEAIRRLPKTTKHETPEITAGSYLNSSRHKTGSQEELLKSYKNYMTNIKARNLRRKREDDELKQKQELLKGRYQKPNRRLTELQSIRQKQYGVRNEDPSPNAIRSRGLPNIRSQGTKNFETMKKKQNARNMAYSEEPDSGGGPAFAFGRAKNHDPYNAAMYDYSIRA